MYNKNSRRLYEKFVEDNELMRHKDTEYYIHFGLKFEKTSVKGYPSYYKIYSTYNDVYQEITQEYILWLILNMEDLIGITVLVNKLNHAETRERFIQIVDMLIDKAEL